MSAPATSCGILSFVRVCARGFGGARRWVGLSPSQAAGGSNLRNRERVERADLHKMVMAIARRTSRAQAVKKALSAEGLRTRAGKIVANGGWHFGG